MNDKKMDTAQYTVGSLFAGMGGFCSAFKSAGFRVLWANENDTYAAETYQHNFPEVKLYTKPIEKLSVLKDSLEPVDVLTAGFPCQPFSLAGNKLGFKDKRGKLFFEITRLLREFGKNRPKILLLENVRNLLTHNDEKTFNAIIDDVQSAGYWFEPTYALLNTKVHTDIPQNRERLYMVAFSWDAFDYIDFEFPQPVDQLRDVKEFLDLDQPAAPEFYFDKNTKYGKMFVQSMTEGDPDSVYLLRRAYVRENKNGTVFTLTANMGEGGHNVPVFQDNWGIRKLTPLECLRLQGFDEKTFSFPSNLAKGHQYKQIGNAVTVKLVEKLANECLRKLQELKGE